MVEIEDIRELILEKAESEYTLIVDLPVLKKIDQKIKRGDYRSRTAFVRALLADFFLEEFMNLSNTRIIENYNYKGSNLRRINLSLKKKEVELIYRACDGYGLNKRSQFLRWLIHKELNYGNRGTPYQK
ncbi:MAG: hypothetical protein V5A47_12185 [Bacteroidales bacterium]